MVTDVGEGTNDQVSLTLEVNGTMETLLIEAGHSAHTGDFPYPVEIVWSNNNDLLEFSIVLDEPIESGDIVKFNVSYSDNDGDGIVNKMYPIAGSDKAVDMGNVAEIMFN